MYAKRVISGLGTVMKAGFAALVMAVGLSLAATPVLAQSAKKKTVKKSKAKWLKLCDKIKVPDLKKGQKLKKGEKPKFTEKTLCMTLFEHLSIRTGGPVVSATIQEITGKKEKLFSIKVPLGTALPLGAGIKFFDKDKKAVGKPFSLPFAYCNHSGCVAESKATDDILKRMKQAKYLGISVVLGGRRVGFPVPMETFNKAFSGPPSDSKKYMEKRKRFLKMAIQRRKEFIEKVKQKRAEEKAKGGK
jgi:invasion protein IalB